MSERQNWADRRDWTADERIILKALMERYRKDPIAESIYSGAIRDAEPEMAQLMKAREYLARIEAYQRQRDEQERQEADRQAEERQEAAHEGDEQQWEARLEMIRAAFQAGNITEFPNGREPEEEALYIGSDHPHPYAAIGEFTDLEWAIIAGLHEAACSWRGAAEDGTEGVEGIKPAAGPHIWRNLAMAEDEWRERFAGLAHDLDYYRDSEINPGQDQPSDGGVI